MKVIVLLEVSRTRVLESIILTYRSHRQQLTPSVKQVSSESFLGVVRKRCMSC